MGRMQGQGKPLGLGMCEREQVAGKEGPVKNRDKDTGQWLALSKAMADKDAPGTERPPRK